MEKNAKFTPVWIFYNESGQIYMARVADDRGRIDIPVSNTTEKVVRRTMRELFGPIKVTTVHLQPNDAREC